MMMKSISFAPLVLGLSLLSGQSTSTQGRAASLDDVLSELRALRTEMQRTADASLRAQLLVARLQVQEQRIAGLSRELSETESKIRDLEAARNPMLSQMLKNFQSEPVEPAEEAVFAGIKAHLEKIENGDPVLKERQATLSRLVSEEQARWVAFNAQLEALEKSVSEKRR